jgi:hypothetical protein
MTPEIRRTSPMIRPTRADQDATFRTLRHVDERALELPAAEREALCRIALASLVGEEICATELAEARAIVARRARRTPEPPMPQGSAPAEMNLRVAVPAVLAVLACAALLAAAVVAIVLPRHRTVIAERLPAPALASAKLIPATGKNSPGAADPVARPPHPPR